MARLESIAIGGYYPTPPALVPAIAARVDAGAVQTGIADPRFRRTTYPPYHLGDPCAGDGAALLGCVAAWYGTPLPAAGRGPRPALIACELEPTRAAALRAACAAAGLAGRDDATVFAADAFQLTWRTDTAARGVDLLWLNPPYDRDPVHGRLEQAFLARFTPALAPGTGILVFVVPGYALAASAATLATEYEALTAYRFPPADYAAFKQVVLLARRRRYPLPAGATAGAAAQVQRWAADPAALPVLPAPGSAPPDLALPATPAGGLTDLVAHPLDVQALLAAYRPWTTPAPAAARGRCGPAAGLAPLAEVGVHQTLRDFLQRVLPVAMPPKPAYLALLLPLLHGQRVAPDDPASGWPAILVKGRFRKDYRTVKEHQDKQGRVQSLVQVQQPVLTVTVLVLSTPPRYVTLAPGTTPSGAPSVDAMNVADLLVHYGRGLGALVAAQFPALHDPTDPAALLPLPPLGRRLYTAQAHVVQTALKLLGRGHHPFVLGEVGSGKCVHPATRVCVNGVVQTVAEVWAAYAGEATFDGEGYTATPRGPVLVASLDETDGRIGLRPVTALWRQRIAEPLRTIALVDGRTIRCTRAHHFLTPAGWSATIQPGSYVAVPRLEPFAPDAAPAPVDPRFLAWALAEGYEAWIRRPGHRGSAVLRITQKDPAVLESLLPAARDLGMSNLQVKVRPGRGALLDLTATPALPRLAAAGYTFGLRSAHKRVPASVMRGDAATARAFLRAYAAAEGSVARTASVLEIMTASEGMAHDLCTLLRRFGIYARIHRRIIAGPTTGIRRPYYRLTVSGNACRRFADRIGCEVPAKAARLAALGDRQAEDNLETVYVADLLPAAKRLTGLSAHRSANLFTTHNLRGTQPTVNTSQAAQLAALLEAAPSAEAQALATTVRGRIAADVFYVKVKSVHEEPYTGWVYDLEVPGTHNFVADHVVVHNTMISLAVAAALTPAHYATTRAALRAAGCWTAARPPRPIRHLLVLVPPHLRASWVEQVRLALPGADAVVVARLADLQAPDPAPAARAAAWARARRAGAAPPQLGPRTLGDGQGPGAGLTVTILSRETAKLGPATRPGVVAHPPLAPGQAPPVTCPRCGAPVPLAAAQIVARHARCAARPLQPAHPRGALARDLAALLRPAESGR